MRQVAWVDRGQSVSFEKQPEDGPRPNCVGVARLGSLQTSGTVFTVWMQLRGSAWVESREGRFRLRQREWIAFEKDSRPLIQASRDGLCIGVALDAAALRTLDKRCSEPPTTGEATCSDCNENLQRAVVNG